MKPKREREKETRQTTSGSSREPIYFSVVDFFFLGLREATTKQKYEKKKTSRKKFQICVLKELRNES